MKLLIIFSLVLSVNVSAKKLKIAILAPQGTTWSNSLKDMGKEIKKATKGKVKFKVYAGGVAGDEPDVLRKIRVGQLHGAVFTGKTLGDINGNVRAMELPFNFYNNRELAFKTLEAFSAELAADLDKKGFETLGFYEIGQVYVVSTKKISSLASLKGVKIWSWEGDELIKALMDDMKLVSVPLALPDVLSSLSTGVIQAAYAPPLGILALQWQTKVKYLINFPVAYSIGAFVISKKRWKKIAPDHRKMIREIADKHMKASSKKAIAENVEALTALKKAGIKFVDFPKADIAKGATIRAGVISKLEGKLIDKKTISKLDKLIKR